MMTFLAALFLLSMVGLVVYYFYDSHKRKRWLDEIFDINESTVLNEQIGNFEKVFQLKLTRAGITKKEVYEVFAAGLIGASALIFLVITYDFGWFMKIVLISSALLIGVGTAPLYLEEQITSRIKRIEEDLSIFIDLLIIMLEGGSGLNNAIDYVVKEGRSVVGKDLIEEFTLFKYEYITYGSKIAYENIAYRTGSEAIASMAGFMRLSEETGIGVKTVFENQSHEIKEREMLSIEKKAATMNINLTLVMFIFILPAMIAMIAFPISSDALFGKF